MIAKNNIIILGHEELKLLLIIIRVLGTKLRLLINQSGALKLGDSLYNKENDESMSEVGFYI